MKIIDNDLILDTSLPTTDLKIVLSWFNDPEVVGYLRKAKYILNIKDVKGVEDYIKNEINKTWFWIYLTKPKKLVGYGILADCKDKKCELGLIIGDKTFWGKGVGLKVSNMLIQYAFNNLNVDKVYATTSEFNQKALSLTRKIGFKIIKSIPEDRISYHDSKWVTCATIYMELDKKIFKY